MMDQTIGKFRIRIITADELGGFPMTGKSDAAIIEVFEKDANACEYLPMDSAWVVIDDSGRITLER